MRDSSPDTPERFGGIVCPVCFAQLAEQAGIARLWRLSAERVDTPLQTVLPDGRVWDEHRWLWVQPTDRWPH
jgi:hypothetical protein